MPSKKYQPPCANWQMYGTCKYGSRCKYTHLEFDPDNFNTWPCFHKESHWDRWRDSISRRLNDLDLEEIRISFDTMKAGVTTEEEYHGGYIHSYLDRIIIEAKRNSQLCESGFTCVFRKTIILSRRVIKNDGFKDTIWSLSISSVTTETIVARPSNLM